MAIVTCIIALLASGCASAQGEGSLVILNAGHLLRPQAGPWDGNRQPSPDAAEEWRRLVDWATAKNFDALLPGVPLDRIYGGWAYHYLIDFDRHPEARVLPADKTRQYHATIRQNLQYAEEQGIRVFIHHYNFCATSPFCEAHPRIKKAPRTRYMDAGKENVIGDVCWREPAYRQFLIDCWHELFETYPELDGIKITIGECNHCPEHAAGEEYINTTKDFVSTFNEQLRGLGKLPIVRTWWMREIHLKRRVGRDIRGYEFLPEGPAYMMKYSLYDVVTDQPDDELLQWREHGFDLYADMMTWGENTGSLWWADPEFQWRRMKSLERAGVDGISIIRDGSPRNMPLYEMNFLAECKYAHHPGEYDETYWLDYCGGYVGNQAGAALRAMKLSGRVVRGISRVLGLPDEGLNVMGFYYFPPYHGWPGTIGSENMNPPESWRNGIAAYYDIVRYVARQGWSENVAATASGDLQDPFDYMDELHADAAEAVDLLRQADAALAHSERDTGEQRRHIAYLLRHATACGHYALYWKDLMRARLLAEGVRAADSASVARELTERCMASYDDAVAQLERVMELAPHGNGRQTITKRKDHRPGIVAWLEELQENAALRERGYRVAALELRAPERAVEIDLQVRVPGQLQAGKPMEAVVAVRNVEDPGGNDFAEQFAIVVEAQQADYVRRFALGRDIVVGPQTIGDPAKLGPDYGNCELRVPSGTDPVVLSGEISLERTGNYTAYLQFRYTDLSHRDVADRALVRQPLGPVAVKAVE